MNRIHEKNLRSLTGVAEGDAVISEKVKARVERAEERMTRFFGRFTEMTAETLVCLIFDMPDEKIFKVPEPDASEKPSPEEYIKEMDRGSVEVELEKRGFDVKPNTKMEVIRKMLLDSVNEQQAKQDQEEE